MMRKRNLLIVDDEFLLRQSLASRLADQGYRCVEAEDGEQALERFAACPDIAIVLVDIRMPRMSGLELVAALRRQRGRDVEVIVMTGYGGVDEAVDALRLGASDFIVKPFAFADLLAAVRKCEETIAAREGERQSRAELEEWIAAKSTRVQQLVEEIDVAQVATVETLAIAAEHRDDDTGIHIRRIGEYAAVIADVLGWPKSRIHILRLAAMLHDVGKIGVPDAILLKPGPLTAEEYRLMQAHTEIGYRITSQSTSDLMRCAAEIARSHHERWDGSGYPRGLVGRAIPPEARIVGLCDVYDALRSVRPYKPALDHATAFGIIVEGDGRTAPGHFDPEILEIFKSHADVIGGIFAASNAAWAMEGLARREMPLADGGNRERKAGFMQSDDAKKPSGPI